MQVIVTCTGCLRQLRLPEEVVGQPVRCPLCQATFETRATSSPGRADAVPLTPSAPRSLSLDEDEVPDAPLSPQQETPDLILEEVPPEPSRRERGRGLGRGPEVGRDERPPGRRRRFEKAAFRLYVHRDPNGRLSGVFEASADGDGVRLWRGRGRVIEVRPGTFCEYLGSGRLLVEIEGRKVELSAVHPDGLHDDLARSLDAVLSRRDGRFHIPHLPVGPSLWMALLPLGIPVLAVLLGRSGGGMVGGILFGLLALVLVGACLAIVLQRKWTTGGRVWGAGLTCLAGYLVLAVTLSNDRPRPTLDIRDGDWLVFAPVDGGYRVDLPASPVRGGTGRINLPGTFLDSYQVALPENTLLFAAHTDQFGDVPAPQRLTLIGQAMLQHNAVNGLRLLGQRDVTLDKVQGKVPGKELHLRSRDGINVTARFYANGRRLFALAFCSSRLTGESKEAKRFFGSFAFDETSGWPGPGTHVAAANPVNPVPGPVPVNPMGPFVPPGMPAPAPGLDPACRVVLDHNEPLVGGGFSKEGNRLAVVDSKGLVLWFDAAGKKLGSLASGAERVYGAVLSPDGKQFLVLMRGGNPRLVKADEGKILILSVGKDTPDLPRGAFSPDGRTAAVTIGEKEVALWDTATGKARRSIPLKGRRAMAISYTPDGKTLVVGFQKNTILLDPVTGEERASLAVDGSPVAVVPSPDSRTLFVSSITRKAGLWDLEKRAVRQAIPAGSSLYAAAFHPAGGVLAAGNLKGEVHAWDAATARPLGKVRVPDGMVLPAVLIRSLSFAEKGRFLAVVLGRRLEVWDVGQKFDVGRR